jgi:O6-methylguanine-DNA--protein-cysteine methyltransferase
MYVQINLNRFSLYSLSIFFVGFESFLHFFSEGALRADVIPKQQTKTGAKNRKVYATVKSFKRGKIVSCTKMATKAATIQARSR